MITIILSVILFGLGGWFSSSLIHDYLFPPISLSIIDNIFGAFIGCLIGAIVGLSLSIFLARFVARKRCLVGNKIPLLPFSDEETYLALKNETGDIQYCRSENYVETIPVKEIAILKINPKAKSPYLTLSLLKGVSFWSLFATFMDYPNTILIVPKETMIKKGCVKTTTITTHKFMPE